VDGYSTGGIVARAFSAHGFDSVHVQSSPAVRDLLVRSFRPDDYVDRLLHQGDEDELCARLTAGGRKIECVVPAAESGVLLADRLSERLGCPSNGTALSMARRDKWLMSRTVAAAHLRTIPQLRSGDPAEIMAWTADRGFTTVVLKPPASSGTYGFHICQGPDSIAHTAAGLLGSRDIFGTTVDEVIAQPYVTGTEFCVNAVSHGGRHLVSDVWLTRKRRYGQSNLYDLETMLSPLDPRYGVLTGYVGQVLDALGIEHGPSHTEVMLTPEGPVLIETAARFMVRWTSPLSRRRPVPTPCC
jgi:L-amino acid ligase